MPEQDRPGGSVSYSAGRAPEFTGERVIPGVVDDNLFNEHMARYRFAARFARAARVLDAGCGTGYGAAELAGARSVLGVDVAADAISAARESYGSESVRFLQARCEQLPFADRSFDLVVAFEVIEHLAGWHEMLSEAARVLRDTGVLLVSTPNRDVYSESRDGVANPYHVHEFEFQEFESTVSAEFRHVHLWVQNHSEAITFVPMNASCGAFDAAGDPAPHKGLFFMAACSQSPIEHREAFAWLPCAGNLLRERARHISLLESELAQKNRWLAEAQQSHAALQQQHEKTEAELRKSNQWAEHLNAEIERARSAMDEARRELTAARNGYESKIAELETEAAARLRWVADLEDQIARGNEQIRTLDELVNERTKWAHALDSELSRARRENALLNGSRLVRAARALRLMRQSPGDGGE